MSHDGRATPTEPRTSAPAVLEAPSAGTVQQMSEVDAVLGVSDLPAETWCYLLVTDAELAEIARGIVSEDVQQRAAVLGESLIDRLERNAARPVKQTRTRR